MSSRNMQLLSEAVGLGVPAIVAVGEGVVRRELLIKFVAEVYDPEGTGYWAVVHEGDPKLIDKLIEAKEVVMVGLQSGGAKIFFETVIITKRRANLMQRQILLQMPEKASVVEQRLMPREWVPERACIAAKVEVLSAQREVLGAFEASLWDLGQDGASIVVASEPLLEELKTDAPLRLEIHRADPQMHLSFEAKHRHTECISDEKIRLGIQFAKDAKSNKAAREALMRLLEELHREGIRDAVAGTLGRPTSEGTRRRRSA